MYAAFDACFPQMLQFLGGFFCAFLLENLFRLKPWSFKIIVFFQVYNDPVVNVRDTVFGGQEGAKQL